MRRLLRQVGDRYLLYWAALVLLVFATHLRAQARITSPNTCERALSLSTQGAELERSVKVRPTVAAYDALGSLFAQEKQLACAVAAFRSALSIDGESREARYNLALALRLERKPDEAQSELQTLVAADPKFALAYEAMGEIAADQKNYDSAVKNFHAALSLDGRLTTASEGMVQASLLQGRPQAAAYWATRALALAPPNPAAYRLRLNLGIAQGQSGDYAAAERTLRELVASFPNKVDPHVNLGIIEVHLQKYSAGISEFSEALGLDGSRNEIRLSLAQVDLLANHPDNALRVAAEYNRYSPRDAEGLSTLARAYQALNDCSHAIPEFRRSLAIRPGDYDTLFGLGSCLMRTGNAAEALPTFRSAELADATKPSVHYEIFRLLMKDTSPGSESAARAELAEFKRLDQKENQNAKLQVMGAEANARFEQDDPQKAAELYRTILESHPNDAKNHYNYSLALARLNDREGEIRELRTAISLDPQMTKAHERLGVCEEEQGHLELAAKEFQTVLQDDPASTDAKTNLGVVYGKAGQLAFAEKILREVASEAPDSVAAQLNLGLVLSSEKRWQDALIPLQAAATLEPNNPQPLTLLGIVFGKMGDSENSITYLKRALKLAPESAGAHLNLGIALADGFDLVGAGEQFAEAERLAPTASIVHYNAGRVAFDLGDQAKARLELEQACSLQRDYPEALQLLGQLEIQGKQFDSAITHLSRVTVLQPQNSDAAYLLGRAFADSGRKGEAITEWQHALQMSSDDTRLLWVLAHELPASDSRRSAYLAKVQAIQGSERAADSAKTLANLGITAAADHEWTEAVTRMSEAIHACQQCGIAASLQQNLGLIYAHYGNLRQAERALKRSVEIDPNIPLGKEELAMVEKLMTHPAVR